MSDKPSAGDTETAINQFTEYFCANYPGPSTVITDPKWHAPKIFRAAQSAMESELAAARRAAWDAGAKAMRHGLLVRVRKYEKEYRKVQGHKDYEAAAIEIEDAIRATKVPEFRE